MPDDSVALVATLVENPLVDVKARINGLSESQKEALAVAEAHELLQARPDGEPLVNRVRAAAVILTHLFVDTAISDTVFKPQVRYPKLYRQCSRGQMNPVSKHYAGAAERHQLSGLTRFRCRGGRLHHQSHQQRGTTAQSPSRLFVRGPCNQPDVLNIAKSPASGARQSANNCTNVSASLCITVQTS
jgi:hypothetical protein